MPNSLRFITDTLSGVGANSLILEHDPATVANLQMQVGKSFMNKKDVDLLA